MCTLIIEDMLPAVLRTTDVEELAKARNRATNNRSQLPLDYQHVEPDQELWDAFLKGSWEALD